MEKSFDFEQPIVEINKRIDDLKKSSESVI